MKFPRIINNNVDKFLIKMKKIDFEILIGDGMNKVKNI